MFAFSQKIQVELFGKERTFILIKLEEPKIILKDAAGGNHYNEKWSSLKEIIKKNLAGQNNQRSIGQCLMVELPPISIFM